MYIVWNFLIKTFNHIDDYMLKNDNVNLKLFNIFIGYGEIPKLFINADPGSILVGEQREFCRSWPNQTEVTVQGLHFLQEDSPKEIGQAIVAWHTDL